MAPLGVGDGDLAQRLHGALAQARAEVGAARGGVAAQHVLDLQADRADRVQRRARALEDHRDLAAAQVGERAFVGLQQVEAAEHRAAAGDLGGAVGDAQQRVAQHRLARAALADQADDLALVDAAGRRLAARARCRCGCGTRGRSRCDVEQQGAAPLMSSSADRRCRAARRPSRLKVNTASISTAPGKKLTHHSPETMNCAPSATRMPHSGVGGRTPRPMKRQAGGVEDRPAHVQAHLHHRRRQDVGEQVHGEDAHVAVARQPRRLDEAGAAPHVGLGARDADVERQVDDRRGQHDVAHRVAQRRDDAHRQHEQREGHDGVGRRA